MKAIGYSGTFDLVTNGHMYVIGEARKLADRVEIYMNENPGKKPKFPISVRKDVIERSVKERGWDNVDVIVLHNEYTAVTAKERGVEYLIRGIRNTIDFDYENLIQQTNTDVLKGAKTLFVMAPRDLGSVSSSFVKMMQGPLGWHWQIKQFLPGPAYETWLLDYLKNQWLRVFKASSVTDEELNNLFNTICGNSGYSALSRFYHNLEHIVHGIDEILKWAYITGAAESKVRLLIAAFFFHDAVYGSHGEISDEEASARLWLSMTELHSAFTESEVLEIADLIRATDHFQSPAIEHPLKDVMLGADLAILGQDYDTVYTNYKNAIPKEYAHVSLNEFRAGRLAAMTKLVNAAKAGLLIKDPYFSQRYNQRAIENMNREIAELAA